MRFLLLPLAALALQAQPFLADYNSELRESAARPDGVRHVDTPALVSRLKELHATTYFYLVWHAKTDWDDLRQEFLPAARAAGIDVWAYLVPPSECRPNCSLPFGDDYVAWSRELAVLARGFPNLKGWAIDDYNANLKTFTPAYMARMREASPGLKFMPLVYYNGITKTFLDGWSPVIDGIIMAYRDYPYNNTQVTATLAAQLDALTALMQPYGKTLVLMIYAGSLSRAPVPPSPAYLRETVGTGMRYLREGKIGGIVTYVLPKDPRPLAASSNPAHGGAGYAVLWIPGGARTQTGEYGELSAVMRATPDAEKRSLRFWRRATFGPAAPKPGYHMLQVLVDGKVAWEQDLAEAARDTWQQVTATVPQGSRVAFRIFEKQGVSSYFVGVGIDDAEAEGFALEDGGFETTGAWTVARSSPAFLISTERFDVNRSRECFEAVRELYSGGHTSAPKSGIK